MNTFSNEKICFKHDNNIKDYYLIPFGHRCSSALAIKSASLRKFSLPFDWTIPLFPNKIKNVLENNFEDFIPDVHHNKFTNKYNFMLAHFDRNINKGIMQYKRRIERFKKIIEENKKMYFVYINEDYLYDEKYRTKEFNDNIFSQMLDLELYLKQKYPKINYTILYFNFFKHKVPKESNIISIVLNTTQIYNNPRIAPYDKCTMYCGKILSNIFATKFIYGYTKNVYNNL